MIKITNAMLKTLYTVNLCKNNTSSDVYNTSHASHDAIKTLCGHDLDHMWYITNNTHDGIINCKQCLQALTEEIKKKIR